MRDYEPPPQVRPPKTRVRIVRFFQESGESRAVQYQHGWVTEEEAQVHCNDPSNRAADGSWFDGYMANL